MFGLVSTVLLRPLPFGDPDKLVMVWTHLPQLPLGFDAYPIHGRQYRALREGSGRAVVRHRRLQGGSLQPLDQDGRVERIDGLVTTAGLFDTLGVHPAAGRFFRAGEDAPGGGTGRGDRLRALGPRLRCGSRGDRIGRPPEQRGVHHRRRGAARIRLPARRRDAGELSIPGAHRVVGRGAAAETGPAEHAVVARMRPGVSCRRRRPRSTPPRGRSKRRCRARAAGLACRWCRWRGRRCRRSRGRSSRCSSPPRRSSC